MYLHTDFGKNQWFVAYSTFNNGDPIIVTISSIHSHNLMLEYGTGIREIKNIFKITANTLLNFSKLHLLPNPSR